LKNGFQAFLSKPIDIIQLDMIVNRYVRNKKLEKELGLTGKKPDSGHPPDGLNKETVKPSEGKPPSTLADKSLEGIDINWVLKRFDDDEETYLKIIPSYFAQIQTILEKMRNRTAESWSLETWPQDVLKDYRIMIHTLKGSSYTIGAKYIGSMAEEIEKAAIAGDIKYINTHSGALIELLEKLIPVLKNFLDEIQNTDQRPLREAPDPALLAGFLKASADYDMEQMDVIMDELERYRYTLQTDLVNWLKKEFNKSAFESIQERLESLNIKADGE
jgi:HPt (histidine-containing phosphotransfer) domain-containing protein